MAWRMTTMPRDSMTTWTSTWLWVILLSTLSGMEVHGISGIGLLWPMLVKKISGFGHIVVCQVRLASSFVVTYRCYSEYFTCVKVALPVCYAIVGSSDSSSDSYFFWRLLLQHCLFQLRSRTLLPMLLGLEHLTYQSSLT